MSVDERADPVLMPRKGALFLLIPVMLIPVVFCAWGVMLWSGLTGRQPDGDEVAIAVSGCPEAREALAARALDMGLVAEIDDRAGGFSIRTRLPADPAAAASIPEAFPPPGQIEVRGGATILATNGDVAEATVRLDLTLSPATLLRIHPEAAGRIANFVREDPGGRIEFVLDGAPVGYQLNREVSANELEIWVLEGEDRERLTVAAQRGVVIDHPLPCPVALL
ncbi:MAG: hypothetical protein H0V89_07100 [Deltaproteobacteria bacterium]|nr:hypothetical protein [Deltaproteobacteria bacterium]